jgi:hypothetical protein
MPAITTAYVRNIIKRGLSEVVDSSPGKADVPLIWDHFDSTCAFCGKSLSREAREGRIDHLVAASQDGANATGNRVLACGPCNDEEKLDQQWEVFLRFKSESDSVFEERRQRITSWQELHPVSDQVTHAQLRLAAAEKAQEVIACFDQKVRELQLLLRD